jgi:hypothetical protein
MSFSESAHPRSTDGTFTNKVGAAAEVSLAAPQYPIGFPVNGRNEDKIEWAYVNGASLRVEVDSGTVELAGPRLQKWWDGWRPGDRFNIVGADLPRPAGDPNFPEGFPANGNTQTKVDWALENNATLSVAIDPEHPEELSGESLQKAWDSAQQFHVGFDIVAAELPEPLSSELNRVTEKLRVESLDDSGVTLNDISALRTAANRAEYRLLEYEAESYLAENHPEVRGLLVSFDAYNGEPYLVGVETDLPEEGSGRNYGTVKPLIDGYEDISGWEGGYSHYLSRFENEGLFDEYGTVLIDNNSEWGEFVDPDKGLGLQESARVYRFGERF